MKTIIKVVFVIFVVAMMAYGSGFSQAVAWMTLPQREAAK